MSPTKNTHNPVTTYNSCVDDVAAVTAMHCKKDWPQNKSKYVKAKSMKKRGVIRGIIFGI